MLENINNLNNLNSDEKKSQINWFPGHMAKTKRELKESIKLVDLIVEIVDSRIIFSSQNRDFNEICGDKPRLIVLNKTDLVTPEDLNLWTEYYKKNNINYVLFSTKNNKYINFFLDKVQEIMRDKIENWKSKHMIGRKIKIMIIGVPNTGKSAFINKISGNSKAKVENRPGVTRRNQWFSVGHNIEILDTPGVLAPRLESNTVANNLAFTGAIKDSILDTEDLAFELINKLKISNINNLISRYDLEENINELSSYEILNLIGKNRNILVTGGEINISRTANMILEEFRSGKLGKIMLEKPEIN